VRGPFRCRDVSVNGVSIPRCNVYGRYGSSMHYLDVHSGSLQVISSGVLVLITGVYTILTRTMAKAAREVLRPYVYLDIFFTSPVEMTVLVGNSGTKVAGNVKISLVASNSENLEKLFSTLPLASGVGHLAPGSTRKYSLVASTEDLFPNDGPSPTMKFEFIYHDGSRSIHDGQEIDLGGYQQSLFPWAGDPGHEIARELKHIADNMPSRRMPNLMYTKACPYCGTKLVESAKKCHGCLEWLPGSLARASIVRSRPHQFRVQRKRRSR
jgi:hypothetical protein